MSAAATASDTLLERATRGTKACAGTVQAYAAALQAARTEADLVERMKGIAMMTLAAEGAEEAYKNLAADGRRALADAMADTGCSQIELAYHTVISTTKAGRVRITDPALIPKEFMRQPEPAPDLVEIGKAIRKGTAVPGAEIASNNEPNIAIKTRKAIAA